MKKQTYIKPSVVICHYASTTLLAGSSDGMNIDIVDGEYNSEFLSKPHNFDVWADDDKEEE